VRCFARTGLPVATLEEAAKVANTQKTQLTAVISTVPIAAGVFLPDALLA
jgi:hypothetical protein